eukprot:946916_1
MAAMNQQQVHEIVQIQILLNNHQMIHLFQMKKTLQLPKIQPLPPQKIKKTIKAKIINRISYKYEQKGFDIWKRNGQRPIYSMTELYCSKTFGKDKNGILKLKKYLITKGGFKTNAIENIKILNNSLN